MTNEPLDALGSRLICQVGLVVRDVEKSAQAYADLFGVDVPSWALTGPAEETHIRFRGQPTAARAKLAFFRFGGVDIELIEPVGGPSTWQEFLDTKGEGVHHIAFRIEDMEGHVAMLKRKGMPLLQCGDYAGGSYSYIDGSLQLGVILELLARS